MSAERLIILEGMSASGKTTVSRFLADLLARRNIDCAAFEERRTVPPETFSNPDPVQSLREVLRFLNEECYERNRIIICDRFHLSLIAITDGSIGQLVQIEEKISEYSPLVVFLEVPEKNILQRVIGAQKYRTAEWATQLDSRGKNEEEKFAWYRQTQEKLSRLYAASTLPKLRFNTGDMQFERIADDIADRVLAQ